MQIYKIELPYAKTIRLVPFGDWHLGNINCQKDKIDEFVDWIAKEKDVYWIGMGDYADNIAPLMEEKRYNVLERDPEFPTIDSQYEWIEKRMAKISKKCLGLHTGNHDFSFMQTKGGHDYVPDICKRYDLRYLGWNTFMYVDVADKMAFTICSTHGSSSARYAGTKLNSLMTWARDFEADIYLYAHTHMATTLRTIQHWSNGEHLFESKKVYCLTGGFLKGYQEGTTSYIERKNLSPLKIGVVKISIYPDRNDIHAEA